MRWAGAALKAGAAPKAGAAGAEEEEGVGPKAPSVRMKVVSGWLISLLIKLPKADLRAAARTRRSCCC